MVHPSYFFIFVITLLGNNFGKCAEFVPVYMWGTAKVSEHVPALHKISEDSFKDTLLEYLKNDPYVIVFAEHTLSPEDFAQRDQNGEIAFPNIYSLKKSQTHVTYKPYVQNPIGAIKQLEKEVTELSIGSLLSSPNVPKNNILIIDLNDAKDDEQRFHMLKRHDSDVVSIYKDIFEQHDNVLAIYTAYHTSWVAPEEVMHKRSRNLLQEIKNATTSIFSTKDIIMYLGDQGVYSDTNNNVTIDSKTFTADSNIILENVTYNGTFTLTSTDVKITFGISVDKGYWFIESIAVNRSSAENDVQLVVKDVYAPLKFSYHCGDLKLSPKATNQTLFLPGFQIQFFETQVTEGNLTFGDAYDCVGFTTVPIWSALFVTAILLLIMTFGLTMMMDIRTMDRFDDAKGKTITINASE